MAGKTPTMVVKPKLLFNCFCFSSISNSTCQRTCMLRTVLNFCRFWERHNFSGKLILKSDLYRILASNLSGMRGRELKLFTLLRSSLSLALSSLITSSGSVSTRAMTLATSSGTYPSLGFENTVVTLFQHADQCEPTRGGSRVLWHPQCVFPKHIRRQISDEELQESKRRPAGMSWSGKLRCMVQTRAHVISQEVADTLEVERIGPQHQVSFHSSDAFKQHSCMPPTLS